MLLFVLLISLAVALVAFPGPLAKLRRYSYGFYYMIRSSDLLTVYGSTTVRPSASTTPPKDRVVRVIFIRHGQSVWNSVANSFGPLWPVRFVRVVVTECILFWLRPRHSLIIDTPLSAKGRREAKDVSDFVRTSKEIPLDARTSIIVTSNLRRAMETALGGLAPRVQQTGERIFVDSFLQEATRQIDAQSFSSSPGRLADCPIYGVPSRAALAKTFDPAYNLGSKDLKSNVITRTTGFVSRIFNLGGVVAYAPAGGRNEDIKTIVVVGHSGWFRAFFRRFLPKDSTHISKKNKMRNGAVVSFDLAYRAAASEVVIEESTINSLYLGFGK